MHRYDYVIVGGGLYGAVFADIITGAGKSALVVDKRKHIGGNCYDKKVSDYYVHRYGPHIFHTSNRPVWRYVNRHADFLQFVYRPKARVGDTIYSFPINLLTLHQLWGVSTPLEAKEALDERRVRGAKRRRNFEEAALYYVGEELYNTFYKGYTAKQWGRDPKDVPAGVFSRLPVRTDFDDNYFNDTYQGIPKHGYANMISSMLSKSDVLLGADFLSDPREFSRMGKRIVYTGRIDDYFDRKHGELEYRSIRFEDFEHPGDFQGAAVVNYPGNEEYTRITEHKHFYGSKSEKSICTKEFPSSSGVPAYPVRDERNTVIYGLYEKEAVGSGVIFGGRLAEYRYYDMHQVIAKSLRDARDELSAKVK